MRDNVEVERNRRLCRVVAQHARSEGDAHAVAPLEKARLALLRGNDERRGNRARFDEFLNEGFLQVALLEYVKAVRGKQDDKGGAHCPTVSSDEIANFRHRECPFLFSSLSLLFLA